MIKSNKKSSVRGRRHRAERIGHAVQHQQLESRELMSSVIIVNSFADVTHSSGTVISLRDAITMANNADQSETIKLPGGTYILTQNLLTVNATVTIEPVSGTPIISGGHDFGVFSIGGSGNVIMDSLTIENGLTEDFGGGIFDDGKLTLNSCVVTGNTVTSDSGQGGGIFSDDSITINGCTISNNSIGSNVEDTLGLGGGLANADHSVAVITNTTLTGNTAAYGGGISSDYDSPVNISASTVSGNSVSGDGGGIFAEATLTAHDVTIINNGAEGSGGGFYDGLSGANASSVSSLINCTITGNSAAYTGAGSGGGGIFSSVGTSIGNSVVAQNTVSNSGSATDIGADFQGPVASLGSNVIGIADDNASSSGFTDSALDQFGMTANPLDPELSAPSGSPAVEIPIGQSQFSGPPYYNGISSPLIDAGNNSLVAATTDGRGMTRIVNGTVDVGAVESQLYITPSMISVNVATGVPVTFSLGTFSDPGSTGPYHVIIDYGNLDDTTTVATTGSLGKITNTYTTPEVGGDVAVIDGAGTVAFAGNLVSINAVDTPTKLTGTTIGTSGSYQGAGDTITNATDGDLTSYYNAAAAGSSASTDNWVGLDLGSTGGVATEVSYASRPGWESRMNGGMIQASNSATFSSGVTTLYTIGASASPPSDTLTFSTFSNSTPYRYYRYLSPNNSFGNVAELQLFGTAGGLTPPLTQLTGITIGTSGSFQNDGSTIVKATDGNLSTFFDAASAGTSASNDNWVGLDLGPTGGVVSEVKYASRAGWQSRMNGGMIQASSSATFSSGVVTLYTIGSNASPPSGTLTTSTFANTTAYRYYRYLSPNGSYGNIAELQLFGTAGGLATVFSGTTIGTSGSFQNDGNTIAKATDGNLSTFFDGATAGTSAANDNWVGLDLGTAKVVTEVAFASRSGWAARMNGGQIQASNNATFASGVVTLYTIGANANPPVGTFTTAVFSNSTAYRYYRYLSPNGSYGDIAELEFLSTAVPV